MAEAYLNYINGTWVAAAEGALHENVSPADTRDIVSVHAESKAADAEVAVAAARAAFPAWRDLPAPVRGDYLFRAAAYIRKHAEAFGRDMAREMGKPLGEAKGETLRAAQIFEFYGGEGRRLTGETYPADGANTFLYTLREPLGVVALITPWNFPAAIPAWKLAPALIYGNAAVVKPATNAPLSAVHMFEALAAAELPAGVANLVWGPGGELGEVFAASADVKAISFTGSYEVGTALAASAQGRRLVKVQLELGGKNPLILDDAGDLGRAVACAVEGAFTAAGQKCTATSRVLVPRRRHDEFVAAFVAAAKKVVVGNPLDAGVYMGPVVDEPSLKRILAYVEGAKEEGAVLACGGARLTGKAFDNGYYLAPTVVTGVTPAMTLWREEVFGPVVGITPYDDFEQALALANDTTFGLAASFVTNDLGRANRFVKAIEAGLVHVNRPTVGASCHVPFGGYKGSSSGSREQGRAALDFFTQTKTVYMDG